MEGKGRGAGRFAFLVVPKRMPIPMLCALLRLDETTAYS